MSKLKHHWIISTSHPDICSACGEVRGPSSAEEICVPCDWRPQRRYILIRRTQHNEFRVNILGGPEATASYHTDLEDAIGTGRANWPWAEVRYRGKIAAPPKELEQ